MDFEFLKKIPYRKWLDRAAREPRVSMVLVAAAILVFMGLVWRSCGRSEAGKAKPKIVSNLFTGKESKRKVDLVFVSEAKALPEKEEREIYETAALSSQAKQVVLDLMEGPKTPGLSKVFPDKAGLRELFIGKDGLCVVDLSAETGALHPGGTTAEYLTLFSLVHGLMDNFPEIHQVQVLVQGQRQETLAGHYDISAPLDKSEF